MLSKNKITNHPVFKTGLWAFAIFFGIIFIAAIMLKIYTMHGSARTVPDLQGLSFDEAVERIDDNGLNFVLSDSVFKIGVKPGAVIDQNPKAGSQVKKNRKIYIVINALRPQMIEMPNVIGVSRRQAKSLLESSGLLIGHIKYVPDIAFDNVLNQRYNGKEIHAGTTIAKGSKVELYLGKGYAVESASIPEIKGLTLSAAQSVLTDSYLNLGVTVYDKSIVTNKDSINAIIFKQKPTPEAIQSAKLGSYIDVWLTLDSTKLEQHSK